MAKSPAEQYREVTNTLGILLERADQFREGEAELWTEVDRLSALLQVERDVNARQQEELAQVRRELSEARAANRESEKQLADQRQVTALVAQRLDDHLKRVEVWDTRKWGLVTAVLLAVFGAALSYASGLLLATIRK